MPKDNGEQFSNKGIHYWIQWYHRSAQFSLNSICEINVSDVAGNVSPTKQASSDSGKKPKPPSVEKHL